MEKWSTLINEANKKDFIKKMVITLDNGTVLEAMTTIRDINENMATVSIKGKLLNYSIKNIKIIESIEMEDKVISEDPIDHTEEIEYYIPYSSIFDEIHYDRAKMIDCLKDDEDVISIHPEQQFGWNNQPEVLVVKLRSEDLEKSKRRLTNKLQHCFGTEWMRMSEKDWK
jgi:hypothetical protein